MTIQTDTIKPTQAVILAGGRGTRLQPFTNTMPKPMIPINGKPFLEYLIIHLKEQGFKRILLLLGYLPDKIQKYFGDGSSFGVEIEYSITDVENETGRRIKLAKNKLDSCFLLMYCDNYWPMNFEAMWKHFIKTGASAQFVVYTNPDNYTKNNVIVDSNGIVTCYDKSRSIANLRGVDIGFAIIKKETLDILPDENVNFEAAVYQTLVNNKQISAYLTDHRYYSVGSYERLGLTESFLKRNSAIILDRDGVLNEKAPKAEYIRTWKDFKWLSGAKEAIYKLKQNGYTIIVVTNQAGIARGKMGEGDLADIHQRMKDDLSKEDTFIDAIYYCPHGWDEGCDCRKPKPGMLFQAQRDFHIDLSYVVFIGDDIIDKEAAEAAGCKFMMVDSKVSLLQIVEKNILSDEKVYS